MIDRALLMKMIRHALYKGYHKPYNDILVKTYTNEKYYIPIDKDKSIYKYRCMDCNNIFRRKEIKRDHIEPIISVYEHENGVEDILDRAFCGIENLQLLCKECHQIKSNLENKLRKL